MRRMMRTTGMFVLGLTLMVPALSTAAQKQPDDVIDKVMKRVGPAFGQLRKALDSGTGDTAAEQAKVLQQAFADTEAFFKSRSKSDAVQWAQDASKLSQSIQKDLGAKNVDGAKASAGDLGKACQTCHTAYRDKAEDGTYRLKPGTE